jgi:hypothetical protein
MNRLFICFALAIQAASAQSSAQVSKSSTDLSGTWLRSGGGGNNYPMSQWTPEKLPFTAAGLKKFNSNKPGKGPRMGPPAFGNDPIGGANPPGLYRTLIYSRPFEMIQLPGKVVQMFQWGKIWRVIYTDGRAVPEDVAEGPFWYGYSVGKWEGDTLVVHTLALDERAWMDEWGTPFSGDAKFEERWRRVASDKIELTIKVTDPAYYEKPWTSNAKVFSTTKEEVTEVIFAPMDEQVFNERIRDTAGGVKK